MLGVQYNSLNGLNRGGDVVFRLLIFITALQLYLGGFADVIEEVFAEQFQLVGGTWVEYDGKKPWSAKTYLVDSTSGPDSESCARRAGFLRVEWCTASNSASLGRESKDSISRLLMELPDLVRHQNFFAQNLHHFY